MRASVVPAVVAGPLYVVVSLIEVAARDGFDPRRHAWSQLANGDAGWIHVATLIGTGLLVVAGAYGWRAVLGRGAWAPRLLAVYGLSMVAAGVFRADPGRGFPAGAPETAAVSGQGMLHFLAGAIGFPCLVAACLVMARRYRAAGETGWAAFSTVTGVAFGLAFAALAAGGGAAWSLLAFTAAVILASAWISLVSWRFARRSTERKVRS
jgi:hypothetical protein